MANVGMFDETIDRAIAVYDAIHWYIEAEERAPVIRELMVMADIPSSAVMQQYLGILRGWGWIDWSPRKSRTMRVTRPTETIFIRPRRKAGKRHVA